jgi:hypothetical protein
MVERICRKVATLSSVACNRNLRSATSLLSSKTRSYRMPSLSLRCSLSGWVAWWRHSRLAAPKARGSLRQVLEEAGKDMDAKNCIRGSGGQRGVVGVPRGMEAMARGS